MLTNRVSKNRICKWCDKHFENIIAPDFANHVRWCDKNPRDEKQTRKKISKTLAKKLSLKRGEIKEYNLICLKCNESFICKEYENLFDKNNFRFCGVKCANSYSSSFKPCLKGKKKNINCTKCNKICEVSITSPINKFKCDDCKLIKSICKYCNSEIKHSYEKVYCNIKCKRNFYRKDITIFSNYKRFCAFNFSLKNFPDEFDFSLIEKYGWYSASTSKKPNLSGVSRDHIFSVKQGYIDSIDPYYISHPANCQLLRQTDNSSKCMKCDITFEALKIKVENWNLKYGPLS